VTVTIIIIFKQVLPGNIPLQRESQPNSDGLQWGGLTSDKAVDGRTFSGAGWKSATVHQLGEPVPGQPAEWWIDLGMMARIYTVTLHNTRTKKWLLASLLILTMPRIR